MWDKFPIKTLLVLIFIFIVTFVVMGVRFPAQGREENIRDQTVELLARRLGDIFGTQVEVKSHGPFSENEWSKELLTSLDQPFVIRFGESLRLTSFQEVIDLVRQERDFDLIAFNERLHVTLRINEGEFDVYQLILDNDLPSVFVGVTHNDNALIGILPMMSRDLAVDRSDEPQQLIEGCSEWLPLSLNILRQPAEQIQICMSALCKSARTNECNLSGTPTKRGPFALVNLSPMAPAPGTKAGDTCNVSVNYSVDFLIGEIGFPIFEVLFGFSIGGQIRSSLDCSGNLVIK